MGFTGAQGRMYMSKSDVYFEAHGGNQRGALSHVSAQSCRAALFVNSCSNRLPGCVISRPKSLLWLMLS